MPAMRELKPVVPQPGRPLYSLVKEAIRSAIDNGTFPADQQLPSTKELSAQLDVSLMTAHRALQELMNAGVLRRAQGKGTFVDPHYFERNKTVAELCIGLAFDSSVSLADFYHGQIIEGVHAAAQARQIDIILLRFSDARRNQCDGYLYVN